MYRAPASPAPRDRLAPHLIWEGVLAVLVVVLLVALWFAGSTATFGSLIASGGNLGLIAAGFALSLRTATPNLAVGPLAALAGAISAHLMATSQWPVFAAIAVGVAAVTVIGAVLGLVTGVLSVPAWAVTFGAAAALTGTVVAFSGAKTVPLHLPPLPGAVWFALFLVVSLGGAGLWRVPGVRAALSATRADGEPGRWAGRRAGLGALTGLTVSSLLAAIGGIGITLRLSASAPTDANALTLAAVAAVLLGGTSVFGRRAGIAGTVLGVLTVQIVQLLLIVLDVPTAVSSLVIGLLLIAGLGVTRLIESISAALESRAPPGSSPAAPPLPIDDRPQPRTP